MRADRQRRRAWPYLLAAFLVLVIAIAGLVYEDPFWFVDRGVHLFLRAHGVQDHYVEVDGQRLHYIEALPQGTGPERPIVLIHGLGARAWDWAPLIPELARHGYHVYALDLLGYGSSAKPANGDYSLSGEEQVIVDYMRAVHLSQADVAGWSMGGWLGMLLTLDHPDIVRRLLLFDSAGLYLNPDFDGSLFSPVDRAGLQRLITRIEPDQPFLHLPAFAAHGMLKRMQSNRWIIERSFRSMISGRQVLDFRLTRLHQPVLIVWGTEDKLTPFDQAERLHTLLPQSVLFGFKGCGHLAAAECASAIAPVVLRFLDSEPPMAPSRQILNGRPGVH